MNFTLDRTAPVAVVTGGTRGIGWRTAERLAEIGYSVALCGRSQSEARSVADDLVARFGGRSLGLGVDVSDATQVAEFAECVFNSLGTPQVVVCNAAILGPVGPISSSDMVEWNYALRVNVGGTANVIGSFARMMEVNGHGTFVVLAGGGVGGPDVSPRISAYTTSKAAVVMLVETLAREFAESGLRINAIAPGAFPTSFTAGILQAGSSLAGADLFAATVRNSASDGPFDRYAALLEFLISRDSDWLTGRLLSARWETPEQLTQQREELQGTDRFRLRRIDDVLYAATATR